MYKQDKTETGILFGYSNDLPRLQRLLLTKYHSQTRRNIFLSNGLSQSFENGMLEKGKESSIYR